MDLLKISYPSNKKDSISVIIPALNEAGNLDNTISNVHNNGEFKEIILVDGGSSDDTVEIAKSMGIKVLESSPPRSKQMNIGYQKSKGDILLFLHCDTLLPYGYDKLICQTLAKPGVVAGAFELSVDSSSFWIDLIVKLSNFRSRKMQLPYGDQAIFIEASIFKKIGMFSEISIMEDFEIIRRLRSQGKIGIVPKPVITSARRWIRLGVLQTTIINQFMILGYLIGIDSKILARWYKKENRKKKIF